MNTRCHFLQIGALAALGLLLLAACSNDKSAILGEWEMIEGKPLTEGKKISYHFLDNGTERASRPAVISRM